MTKEQILKKVIEKAVKNGWDSGGAYLQEATGTGGYNTDYGLLLDHLPLIIFDHSFAKAFWSIRKGTHLLDDWQYQIVRLVLAKDRLKYLEKFL